MFRSLNALLGLLVCLSAVGFTGAADIEPTLGKKGKELLSDTFSTPESAQEWTHTVGKVEIKDGALVLAERAEDNHACAVRRKLPLQDAAVQFDFTMDGSRMLHFGYDPAAGELKKKGHLFSVVITPEGWSIIEHNDKADANSKTKTHAKAATKFEPGRTYTLLVECRGPKVVAQIQGEEPLQAEAAAFAVKKPGLVIRVGGDAANTVRIDNLHVWELE